MQSYIYAYNFNIYAYLSIYDYIFHIYAYIFICTYIFTFMPIYLFMPIFFTFMPICFSFMPINFYLYFVHLYQFNYLYAYILRIYTYLSIHMPIFCAFIPNCLIICQIDLTVLSANVFNDSGSGKASIWTITLSSLFCHVLTSVIIRHKKYHVSKRCFNKYIPRIIHSCRIG